MAEKGPDAQSSPPNIDIETRTAPGGSQPQSENIRRRRRNRNIIISVIFLIIFHSLIIIALDLTVFRIRTPKYALKYVTIDNLIVTNSTNSPSFSMKLNADVTIKNKNFGPYKYDDCYINFLYRGSRVADDFIEEAGAKALSTKVLKLSLNVTYNSGGLSDNARLLRSDISSGTLVLRSESEMRGQVEVLKVIKRADKHANMDCSITVDLVAKVVRLVECY